MYCVNRSLTFLAATFVVVGIVNIATMAEAGTLVPNSNPSFIRGSDIYVLEDSGTYQSPWATNITDGEATPGSQSLSFTVTASNSQLFKTQPKITDKGALSFTVGDNQHGTTSVTVVLKDDGTSTCVVSPPQITECPAGCTPVDCSKSSTATFTITIGPVNDCPSFSHRGDQTSAEDAGSVVVTNWAFSVSTGSANENAQKLSWTLNNENTALFEVQPAITFTQGSNTGSLTYKSAANAYGTAKVVIVLKDDGGTPSSGCDRSSSVSFSITITAVNDAPTFAMSTSKIQINEDYGPYSHSQFANTMNVGAPNEDAQQLSFTVQFVDASHASLFKAAPAINSAGTLTFQSQADVNTFNSKVFVYVQLNDDGGGTAASCTPITACGKLEIVITSVNDPPQFSSGSNVEVWEDLRNLAVQPSPLLYTVTKWAPTVSPGNAAEEKEGQTVSFTVTVDKPSIFTVTPAIDSQGTLTFTLSPNKNGPVTVTATIKDNQLTNNVGNSHTFLINVLSSNDSPSFSFKGGGNGAISVEEDSGNFLEQTFLNTVVAGPSTATDESSQMMYLSTTTNQGTLFSTLPSVVFTTKEAAKLSFATASNMFGTATVSLTLRDDGGTARKGVDQVTKTFTITITPVNDAPSFTLPAETVTVVEDQYPSGFSQSKFLTDISAGAGGESATQSVSIATTAATTGLFSAQPHIDSNGKLSFTAQPNAFGSTEVTVTVSDNQTPPKSTVNTFTINILAQNDAPVFTKGIDLTGTTLSECRTSAPCPYSYSQWATGISAGAANENSQSLSFSVSSDAATAAMFSVQPALSTSTGTLTFSLRPLKHTTSALTLTLTLRDSGGILNGGVESTSHTLKFEIPAFVAAPSFTVPSTEVSCPEDSSLQTRTDFLTNVSPGTAETDLTNLRFTITPLDTTLFSTQPTLAVQSSNTVTLTFKPAAHRFGSTDVTVTAEHSTTAKSSSKRFTLAVLSVNDKPVFELNGDVVVRQGSGQYSALAVKSFSKGALESDQTLQFTIYCDPTKASVLFKEQPALSSSGQLTFGLTELGTGTTFCEVRMKDSGGTQRGGQDSADPKTFFIRVGIINHAPSFQVGPDVTVSEDAGTKSFYPWATQLSQGQGDDTTQQLSFTTTCTDASTLFSAAPSIDGRTGSLTFGTAPNANGASICTTFLSDNGPGDAPDVNRSAASTFRVIVSAINDPPTFNTGSNLVVLEDSGAWEGQWANLMSPGPSNEASQSTTFSVTTSPLSMFLSAPSINASGVLRFTLNPNENGIASATVCLKDNGGGSTDTTCRPFTISVVAVNDAPSLHLTEYTITQLEDAGDVSVPGLIATVNGGPPNEGQASPALSVAYLPDYQSACSLLFSAPPTLSLAGTLSFRSKPNANGQCKMNVTAEDDNGLGVDVTMTIVVLPVNDPPSAVYTSTVSALEGSPFVVIGGWLSKIFAGPTGSNEDDQLITANVTTPDPSLFSSPPIVVISNGSLMFGLRPGVLGPLPFTVVLKDSGGTANNGKDTSNELQGRITITSVNDKPTFDLNVARLPVIALEDSGLQQINAFALRIQPGDATEVGQTLRFSLTTNSSEMFLQQPVIDNTTGTLQFQTAPNRFGDALVQVTLLDSGGTASGGEDTSSTRSFVIHVAPVNDPPFAVVAPRTVTIKEDQIAVVEDWAAGVTAGPYEDSIQSLTFAVVSSLVPSSDAFEASVAKLTVGAGGGQKRNLTVSPAKDYFGMHHLLLRMQDSGLKEDGGEDTHDVAFQLVVLSVNDPPTFNAPSKITVQQGSNVSYVAAVVTSVAAGPSNEVNQTVTLTVAVSTGGELFSVLPTIDANGTLYFQLATSPSRHGTATLLITARDDGGVVDGGVDTATKTVLFEVGRTNQPPTFNTTFSDIAVAAGSIVSRLWAVDIVDPDALSDTARTAVQFLIVSDSNPTLFLNTPAVTANGSLKFTAAATAGTALLAIAAQDSEGAQSAATTVSVTVFPPVRVFTVLRMEAAQFSVVAFQERIGSIFGVIPARVVVVKVTVGSVRVEFYISGEAPPLLSEETFVERTRNSTDPVHQVLPFISATLVPISTFAPGNATTAPPPPTEEKRKGLGRTAIVLIIVAVVLFLLVVIAVVALVVSRRSNASTKKDEDGETKDDGADKNLKKKEKLNKYRKGLPSEDGTGVSSVACSLPNYDDEPLEVNPVDTIQSRWDTPTSSRPLHGVPTPLGSSQLFYEDDDTQLSRPQPMDRPYDPLQPFSRPRVAPTPQQSTFYDDSVNRSVVPPQLAYFGGADNQREGGEELYASSPARHPHKHSSMTGRRQEERGTGNRGAHPEQTRTHERIRSEGYRTPKSQISRAPPTGVTGDRAVPTGTRSDRNTQRSLPPTAYRSTTTGGATRHNREDEGGYEDPSTHSLRRTPSWYIPDFGGSTVRGGGDGLLPEDEFEDVIPCSEDDDEKWL